MENIIERTNSIVIYQTNDGETSIDVKFQDETVWLSQAQMAERFQKDRTVIRRHINNIFKEGELERETTCAKFAHVGNDGDQQFHATYENAMAVIRELHKKFGGSTLFGNEKDESFKSSIGQIYQTFGGVDLYPSIEEKADMLLYLVTKNHSFEAV